MRIALGVEYNGAQFHGWQIQKDQNTLQSTLEAALSRVADEDISVLCAGRTDAGVHASHQVVHFDTNANRKSVAWVLGTNSYLPSTMNISWMQAVDETFHARFSALHRRYQYFIHNQACRSALLSPLTTWISEPLNEQSMHEAAQLLRGEHDFSSFRSSQCQSKTAKRHVFAIEVKRYLEMICIDITANSFLHHMVRNIVGVLIEIGEGRREPAWCEEVLAKRNRCAAGKTAPPQGLFLAGVRYPDNHSLPSYFKSPLYVP